MNIIRLYDLFAAIAFPETPEERDAAESEVKTMLATAWDEGFAQGIEDAHATWSPTPNPYQNFT